MDLNAEELSWLEVVGGGGGGAPVKETPKCELCGGAPDHAHGDCPSLTKPPASGPEGDDGEPPDLRAQRVEDAARHAAELEIASGAGALDPNDDPFAVFAPRASVPEEQPAPPVVAETPRPSPGGILPTCPSCPHPAHVGAACMGKRGSRSCRCKGVAVLAVEQARCEPGCEKDHVVHSPALASGHLPTCVQNDAGKWLCMDGCTESKAGDSVSVQRPDVTIASDGTVSVPETKRFSGAAPNPPPAFQRGEMMVEVAPGVREPLSAVAARETEDARIAHAPPTTGWAGTLQVNVNLGPETLALLTRLFGGR